jgi:glycine cleavage system H protein
MNVPQDLKYTNSHEWIRVEDDGSITVGITEHAVHLLGDLVHIDMPGVDDEFEAGNEILVVESVKAAADVYAPVAGVVTAVNEELDGSPEKVNDDAHGAWLFKMKPSDPGELDNLLSADQYQALISEEE